MASFLSMVMRIEHSHKDSESMGSRNGVEGRDTVLVRGFYRAGTKMTPHFRDGIGVSGSRNGTLDPESCDYGIEGHAVVFEKHENSSSVNHA